MRRQSSRSFVAVAAAAAATLCLASPSLADGDWKVEKVVLARDDGSGAPGKEVRWFGPEDRIQHVTVKFASLKVGALAPTAIFTAVDTAAGAGITIAKVQGGTFLGGNEFHGQVKLPRDFPIGKYRFDLLIGDTPATTYAYHVIADPQKFAVRSHEFLVADAQGKPGAKVERFKPQDKHLYLRAFTNGIVPGTKLTWVWAGVDTAKGKGAKVAEVSSVIQELGIFTLEPSIEPKKGLAPGQYKVDLLLDGALKATFPFEVK